MIVICGRCSTRNVASLGSLLVQCWRCRAVCQVDYPRAASASQAGRRTPDLHPVRRRQSSAPFDAERDTHVASERQRGAGEDSSVEQREAAASSSPRGSAWRLRRERVFFRLLKGRRGGAAAALATRTTRRSAAPDPQQQQPQAGLEFEQRYERERTASAGRQVRRAREGDVDALSANDPRDLATPSARSAAQQTAAASTSEEGVRRHQRTKRVKQQISLTFRRVLWRRQVG